MISWKYLRNSRDEEDLKLEMVVSDEQDNRSDKNMSNQNYGQRVPVIVHRTGHYYLLTGIKKDSRCNLCLGTRPRSTCKIK